MREKISPFRYAPVEMTESHKDFITFTIRITGSEEVVGEVYSLSLGQSHTNEVVGCEILLKLIILLFHLLYLLSLEHLHLSFPR